MSKITYDRTTGTLVPVPEVSFYDWDHYSAKPFTQVQELFTYPGGEPRIQGAPDYRGVPVAAVRSTTGHYLELAMWRSNLPGDTPDPELFIPFLPSARGDKETSRDAQNAAKLIAASGIKNITTIDPHSDVWVESAENMGLSVTCLALSEVLNSAIRSSLLSLPDVILAPDEGAVSRASIAAELLGVPVLFATKTRNHDTGKLSGFKVPNELEEFNSVLIIDDIMDQGGTFAGIVTEIEKISKADVELFITHGVFTGHFLDNLKKFNKVCTTNSLPIKDVSIPRINLFTILDNSLATRKI